MSSEENGKLVATEIRLVVLHKPKPYVGHDPVRTVLDAINKEQDTIVLENVATHTPTEIEIPTRLWAK